MVSAWHDAPVTDGVITQARTVLRYPAFRLLVTGRTVSVFGNALAPTALAFAVIDLTHSVRDLGLVVGTRSVANVLFLLFGGVIADRLPRHLVMVASNGVAAATQAVVAAVVLTHTANIPLLMGLSAINGLASAVSMPAVSALLPQTVPDEHRRAANAISRFLSSGVMIAGAAVGGLLVATIGAGWGLAIDSLTFIVSGACYALVRVPAVRTAAEAVAGIITGLREGWSEFIGRTWLWVVVLGFMFFNAAFAGSQGVLGPVVADRTFGRGYWGLILAAETVGALVGAVVALRLRVRRLLGFGTLAVAGGALLPLALALAPRVLVLVAAAFVGGLAVEQFGIAWETTMQEYVPADRLARVYSYDMLGSFIAIPVGEVAAGPAAEKFGTPGALLIAVGVMLASTVGMLASRDVRRLEHRPHATEPVAP
jgi:MFS family permease